MLVRLRRAWVFPSGGFEITQRVDLPEFAA
jgi:hypothetical protein